MATSPQIEKTANGLRLEQKCSKCGHVKVCAVFRAVGPLLNKSWTPETRPIEPENLAQICKAFVLESVLNILSSHRYEGGDDR